MAESNPDHARILDAQATGGEDAFDRAVRPRTLDEYVGQPRVKEQMQIFIEAARRRKDALDHTLVFGPPGLGKTTLAHIIANELDVALHQTSGPVLERAGDLASLGSRLIMSTLDGGLYEVEAGESSLISNVTNNVALTGLVITQIMALGHTLITSN